jgi:hypothetical protein
MEDDAGLVASILGTRAWGDVDWCKTGINTLDGVADPLAPEWSGWGKTVKLEK